MKVDLTDVNLGRLTFTFGESFQSLGWCLNLVVAVDLIERNAVFQFMRWTSDGHTSSIKSVEVFTQRHLLCNEGS